MIEVANAISCHLVAARALLSTNHELVRQEAGPLSFRHVRDFDFLERVAATALQAALETGFKAMYEDSMLPEIAIPPRISCKDLGVFQLFCIFFAVRPGADATSVERIAAAAL